MEQYAARALEMQLAEDLYDIRSLSRFITECFDYRERGMLLHASFSYMRRVNESAIINAGAK